MLTSIKFNTLKIFIFATDAKPGGLIGAMLSPYLFSINMNDFCKKFNEQSKDYLVTTLLSVKLFCNSLDKTYLFIIKHLDMSLFINFYYLSLRKFIIIYLYDLVKFYSMQYKLLLFKSALLVLSLLKCFRRRKFIILIKKFFKNKIDKNKVE